MECRMRKKENEGIFLRRLQHIHILYNYTYNNKLTMQCITYGQQCFYVTSTINHHQLKTPIS